MGIETAIADAEDALFATVALHNELADEPQIAAALELQKKLAPCGARVTLGEVLLHQGVIDTRTLDAILNLQRGKMPDVRHPLALRRKGLTPERDRHVTEAAVEAGRAPAEKLEEARTVQTRLRELGFDRRLGEILWGWNLIEEGAFDELLHAEKRRARMDGDETRRLRGRVQAGPVTDVEMLFGRLAVKNGFLSQEVLQEALDVQRQCRELGVRLKLPEVLVARKGLTEENVAQLADMMSLEKEQLLTVSMGRVMLRKLDDESMLRTLIDRGFLQPEQADEARAAQIRLKSLGIERRAGEILLDKQFVSNEILYAALDDQLRARLRQALKAAEVALAVSEEARKKAESGMVPLPPAVTGAAPPPSAPARPQPVAVAVAPPAAAEGPAALRAAMVEALRRTPAAAAPPAQPFPWTLALVGCFALATLTLWLTLRDPAPAGVPVASTGRAPTVPRPGTLPTTESGTSDRVATVTAPAIDPNAARSFLEQQPDRVPAGVDHEAKEAVREHNAQEAKESAALLARARALLADADPNELEIALVASATPEGAVFEIFGLAPFPDDIPVDTSLQHYGTPIAEASRVVHVRNRMLYSRFGPLPEGRKMPAGLYTAVAEFSATFALGSEENIRAAGVADRVTASCSAVLGSPEEEAAESAQVRTFHEENLERIAAFERDARAAVDAGAEAQSRERWTESLTDWRKALAEVEKDFEAYRHSVLISRYPEADRQILALLPVGNKALRAVATACLGALGSSVPAEFEYKTTRPGEVVIPQEHLGTLATELRAARESVRALHETDALDTFARATVVQRLETARGLHRDLGQGLATLQDRSTTAQGSSFDVHSPVGWLKKWLTQVELLRQVDRGLQEAVLAKRWQAEQARLDEMLGFLSELGKTEVAALLKAEGKVLPVDLRPLGSTEARALADRLETGWKELEGKLVRKER